MSGGENVNTTRSANSSHQDEGPTGSQQKGVGEHKRPSCFSQQGGSRWLSLPGGVAGLRIEIHSKAVQADSGTGESK